MSEVRVNKLSPRSGTTVTLGDSGDTITIPSGVTLSTTSFSSTGIDDNATSTAITIDSSQNVGIGGTPSFGQLQIQKSGSGNSGGTLVLTNADGSIQDGQPLGNLYFVSLDNTSTSTRGGVASIKATASEDYTSSSGANLSFFTHPESANNDTIDGNTVENFRINAGGNLQVQGTAGLFLSFLNDSNTGFARPSGDTLAFNTGGSERMRITSSGQVSIGTTAGNSGAGGMHVVGTIVQGASGLSQQQLSFSSGQKIQSLFLGVGYRPLHLNSLGGAVLVGTTTAGSAGAGDLVVNGGAFLGGTGTANKLDDYEEGTFTATIEGSSTAGTASYSNQAGKYTKIGNMIAIQIQLSYSGGTGSGTAMYIKGLPFTSSSALIQTLAVAYTNNISLPTDRFVRANIAVNTDFVRLFTDEVGGGATGDLAYDSAGDIAVGGTYFI